MLSRLVLKSVKSFLSETMVPFAPVTLIAGTNSSGKSTIFQTLLLIKQAFEHPALSLDGMHLNGPQATVGSYDDWCSKHELSDVSVSVGISNDALAKNRDLRRAIVSPYRKRRTAAPVLWWADRVAMTRRYRLTEARVVGELGMTFLPSSDSPNDARLKRVSWKSTWERGGESSEYQICVESAIPSDEELDAAALDSDNESERYRYSLTARRTAQGNATSAGPAFCAVEGLLPTSVLNATEERAAAMTIVDLVANVFAWVRSFGLGADDQAERESSRNAKALFDALYSPTKHRLQILAARANRASGAQAASLLGSVSELRLARALVDGFRRPLLPRESTASEDFAAQAQIAVESLFAMTLRLVMTRAAERSNVNSSESAVMEASSKRVTERYPDLGLPVRFLLDVVGLSADPVVREQLAAALGMAEKHAAVDRRRFLAVPTDIALRSLQAADTAQMVSVAPDETAVRRFFVQALFHLGPLRDEPRVLYMADVPLAPHDVGKRGQRAVSCLREFGNEMVEFLLPSDADDDYSSFELGTLPLSEVVSRWGQFLGIFDGLHIDTSEKYGTVVKVHGTMDGRHISPDLTNVGVGVSQVLPILVLCAAMPIGGCALIEQPELHLHPSVQSRLAIFFAACARSGRQVVLESHSEHLVNRMRLMVASGDLQADDVAIVFIERDEYGATAAPIKIQSDGSLERWPRGFLDETERVLAALMRTRAKSRKR